MKKKTNHNKNLQNQKEQNNQNSNLIVFINRYSIYILSVIVFLIGFLALKKYLTAEYLFYFKDIGSDSLNQIYPAIAHKVRMIKAGESDWSFYISIGEVFTSTFDTHPLSVVRTIIDFISVKIWDEAYYINGNFARIFIFHIFLTALVTYFYFRTISIKKIYSIIGSVIMAFSGFMIVGSSWGFSIQIFNAIFLLFAFEQFFVKNRWYFFPFAVMFLCVNPFSLYIYSVFLFLYFIFRYISTEQGNILQFFKLTAKIILLSIAGLLMNIVKIYPILMKIINSPRVSGSASYSAALSQGENLIDNSKLPTTTIYRFFSSDLLGTGSDFAGWNNYFEAPLFYIGLLTLILVPQIFIHLNKRKKIIFGSFLAFWLLTLIFPTLRYAILAFTGDYFRYGFDFFIPFTFLFYAIYALNKLDETFKLNIPLLIGTSLFLIVLLFFPYSAISKSDIDGTLRKVIVLFIVAYSYFVFLMSKPQLKSIAQILILLLVVAELSYFSYKSYAGREPVTKEEFKKNEGGYKDGTIKAVNYIKSIDDTPFYRTEKDYQSGNAVHGSLNDAQAQGYYGTTSYSSFNQLNYVRFLEEIELIQKGNETATRWVTGFRSTPILQSLASVKYHLSKSQNPGFKNFGFDSLSVQNGIYILENKYYLPFGFTYDKYIDFKDFKSLLYYRITDQSLESLKNYLARFSSQAQINQILTQLSSLKNKKYNEKELFITDIQTLLGKKLTEQIKYQILQFSTNNFTNQLALLNGFVYEDDENTHYNIKKFEKLHPTDSTIFMKDIDFNFDKYKEFVNQLKQDTFNITEFKQSNIKGTISLDKAKMLFFTIPFDEGWKAKVNGKNRELSRVNIGFTGLDLDAGDHNIELYFVPKYSQITSLISIISIILFWLYLGYYIYKKRKSKK